MIQIEKALEQIKKDQAEAYQAWSEAQSKYDEDENYDEDFHDTLQRKYDEGRTDALMSVLLAFAEIDLKKISEEIATNGAQDVLAWLEEVYGEGLHQTGAWQSYMDDEEEEEQE